MMTNDIQFNVENRKGLQLRLVSKKIPDLVNCTWIFF